MSYAESIDAHNESNTATSWINAAFDASGAGDASTLRLPWARPSLMAAKLFDA